MRYEHQCGEIVYLITDPDQHPRMITGILIRPDVVLYMIALAGNETSHFACEISKEKNYTSF
jgi:hypothetical protein